MVAPSMIEVCECHALRRINVNVRGDEMEVGEWHADLPTASHALQSPAVQHALDAAQQLAAAVVGESDTASERRTLAQALADLDAAAA